MQFSANIVERTSEALNAMEQTLRILYVQQLHSDDFFKAFVSNLARVMGTKCAFVTELLPDLQQVHMLGFWDGTEYAQNLTYPIKNTPCDRVVNKREVCHHPFNVQSLFPHVEGFEALNAQGYVGVPILSREGDVIGHLVLIHDRFYPLDDHRQLLLQVFASRASFEIEYMRCKKHRSEFTW